MTFHSIIYSSFPATFKEAFATLMSASIYWAPERSTSLFPLLETLGLLDRFESLMSGIVYDEIEKKVAETCPKVWTVAQLSQLRDWLKQTVVPWLASPYARGAKTSRHLLILYTHFSLYP
jgi:anaphase-promoting complex subunit 2